MPNNLASRAACIADLKELTRKRIPRFAYEYLAGGCNSENTLRQNRAALDNIFLQPNYLTRSSGAKLDTKILGQTYAVPFGVAPLGLSGLIWPNAAEYQARAARAQNIPYILSTLASTSIERAAQCAGENFWFQLYPPSDLAIRADLLRRAKAVNCRNLVVTIDVPAAGRRPKDIKNGLSVPPKISAKSILQTLARPTWAMTTARNGLPQFASMLPYIKDRSNLVDIAHYIRTSLKDVVDFEMLQQIRQDWSGNLIVKGILSVADAKLALAVGADAIIVSNHGGRQLDTARASVSALEDIVQAVGSDITVMADSGVESGPDIARFLAQGAQMVFAGRAFMYAVGALGEVGPDHCIELLKQELQQVMEQLRCEAPNKLPQYLLSS